MSQPAKPSRPYLTADQIKAESISSFHPTSDKTLRFAIDSSSFMKGIGTLVTGQVLSGILKIGDPLVIYPKQLPTKVSEIQQGGKSLKQAKPGDMVAILCEGLEPDSVQPGDVGFREGVTPAVGNRLVAELFFLRTPKDVTPGYTPVLYARSLKIPATVAAILAHLNPKTGTPLKSQPAKITPGTLVVVELMLPAPVVLEPYASFPTLGSIALREIIDEIPMVIAPGMVIEIGPK